MKKYIIGVSPRPNQTDTNTFIRVNRNYIDQLTSIDLVPIILTPGSDLQQVLQLCDGFLVIGGDDFNPIMYGENNDEGLSKDIDDELDQIDKTIIMHAVENKKPVLGICRGHQALSAVFGKALHQDFNHDGLYHPFEGKLHNVTKVTNFGVATRLPDEFQVNTYHHQCTKEVADGFVVLFKNHDVIEAIEHTELPILGVQWHPERLETNETKIIFNYFKEKITKHA